MHITPRREARPTTCTWFLPYLGGGTEPARADWRVRTNSSRPEPAYPDPHPQADLLVKLPGLDRAYSGDLTGGDQLATHGPDDGQALRTTGIARTVAVKATMSGDMGASGNDRMDSSGIEDQEDIDGERPAA